MKTLEELKSNLDALEYESNKIQSKIYDAKMYLAHAMAQKCTIEFDRVRLQDFWGVREGSVLKRVQVGGKWDGLVSIWFVKRVLNEGHRISAQIYSIGDGSPSWTQEFASFDAGHFFMEEE
jgi:hypothetical protein